MPELDEDYAPQGYKAVKIDRGVDNTCARCALDKNIDICFLSEISDCDARLRPDGCDVIFVAKE